MLFVVWQPIFSKLCWSCYWSTSGAMKLDHRMLISHFFTFLQCQGCFSVIAQRGDSASTCPHLCSLCCCGSLSRLIHFILSCCFLLLDFDFGVFPINAVVLSRYITPEALRKFKKIIVWYFSMIGLPIVKLGPIFHVVTEPTEKVSRLVLVHKDDKRSICLDPRDLYTVIHPEITFSNAHYSSWILTVTMPR